jgi:5'-nucleotidase
MHRHWEGIHRGLHDAHPVIQPRVSQTNTPVLERSGFELKKGSNLREEVVYPDDQHPDSSDDEEHSHPHVVDAATKRKRELRLARKVVRKWWRLAGLEGQPRCADTLEEDELEVDWTHVSTKRKKEMWECVMNANRLIVGYCAETRAEDTHDD